MADGGTSNVEIKNGKLISSKVNDKVIAQIVPPSLIGSQANTPSEKAISE